jgi:pSer/pThr/pTyr-binding forkhead associated (FHA) protein
MRPTILTVTLTVVTGPRAGLAYEIFEPAVYVLGRGEDCHPRLPDELAYKDVSRRHCLVGLHPCEVWVLDLHSTSGTSVNGARIGISRPEGDQAPVVGLEEGL